VAQTRSGGDKIPITTSSNEARKLYLEGRDLLEKLRATDARHLFEQAAAKDPNFALAYVGLANTAEPMASLSMQPHMRRRSWTRSAKGSATSFFRSSRRSKVMPQAT